MKINSRLSRIVPGAATAFTVLAALMWALKAATGGETWFTLALTFTATAYHFWMRLCVGFSIRPFTPRMNPYNFWFRQRAWEAPLYRALRVRSWKGHMPTYIPGDFTLANGADNLVKTMCAAELIHEVIVVMGYATLLLALLCEDKTENLMIFGITAFVAGLFDMTFVVMQRYNRPRVRRIVERQAARNARILNKVEE